MMARSVIISLVAGMAARCVDGFFPVSPIYAGRQIAARAGDARDFAFEKRELGIWLDKIVDAKRQLSLAPEDRAKLEVQKYVDLLIDEEGSPISPRELAQGDYIAGTWDLAFSSDPRWTIFSAGGDIQVALAIEPRGDAATGKLQQLITQGGKPGLKASAKYSVDSSGRVAIQVEKLTTQVFGFDVPAPDFLAAQVASFLGTSYFNGDLWAERFVADADTRQNFGDKAGAPESFLYNVYRYRK